MASPQVENAKNACEDKVLATIDSYTDKPEDAEEIDVNDIKSSFNPSLSDEENEGDLERIRGDAIGSTLYSERFVLSTLLKLNKLENELMDDDNFEKDLCALWDMTIEEDVVNLLLKHNVLELFAQCIVATEDKRLIEILVGVMGNMCSLKGTRKEICDNEEVMKTLLSLIGCTDSLTLVQLMRLLTVVLVQDEASYAAQWYATIAAMPSFMEDFAFILSNSINEALLQHALEALNAILAKFAQIAIEEHVTTPPLTVTFTDLFVQELIIKGTIEAFQTLRKCTRNTQKTVQIFLNIHCILTQYNEPSRVAYAPFVTQVLECLNSTLEPLCDPLHLLPLSSFEQEVVENVNDIFLAFGDPFDETCTKQMITIWQHVMQELEQRTKRPTATNEFEDDTNDLEDSKINYEDFCLTILDFVTRTACQANEVQLQRALRAHTPATVALLFNHLDTKGSKIKKAFESINVANSKN